MKLFVLCTTAITLSATLSTAQTLQAPEGIRPVAIGNGTPAQGVVRFDGPSGQTYHAVNDRTVFQRFGGGTATVNGGDGIANAYEAEIRNRQAILDSLPEIEIPDYSVAFANIQGELDTVYRATSGAAALAGIDFTGNGLQIGGGFASVEGYASFAIKGVAPLGEGASVGFGMFTAEGVTGGTLSATYAF